MNPGHFADKLTGRQAEVLAFIRACIAMNGVPPTRAEIASHFGFTSNNGAQEVLRALEQKGAVRLMPGASRGIVVNGPTYAKQVVEDLASMRARTMVEALSELDRQCGHCEYDEAKGGLLRHCDGCCRRIVANLGKLRRQMAAHLVRTRDEARKPVQRTRHYARTHGGGTLG